MRRPEELAGAGDVACGATRAAGATHEPKSGEGAAMVREKRRQRLRHGSEEKGIGRKVPGSDREESKFIRNGSG